MDLKITPTSLSIPIPTPNQSKALLSPTAAGGIFSNFFKNSSDFFSLFKSAGFEFAGAFAEFSDPNAGYPHLLDRP